MSNRIIHCCDEMEQNIKIYGLLSYNEVFDEYGLNYIGDTNSYFIIEYCPWCGKKLPESKREMWFNELEQLGYDDPLMDENIPNKFKDCSWRM